jgi:hypothetical protein
MAMGQPLGCLHRITLPAPSVSVTTRLLMVRCLGQHRVEGVRWSVSSTARDFVRFFGKQVEYDQNSRAIVYADRNAELIAEPAADFALREIR